MIVPWGLRPEPASADAAKSAMKANAAAARAARDDLLFIVIPPRNAPARAPALELDVDLVGPREVREENLHRPAPAASDRSQRVAYYSRKTMETGHPSARPRVVILGCGFGGLWAAQGLDRAPVDVTVVDANNYHLFTPLLYQVATAGLSAPDI